MKNLHSNFPQTTANDSKTRVQVHTPFSGRSSPSAKEGAHLTMNIEFCEENSGTSKKMRYFRKNKGERAMRHFKVDPPLPLSTQKLARADLFLVSSLSYANMNIVHV